MRFTHIDVNFDVKYEGHQNCSKTLFMHILRVFGHHHTWHQNRHQYVWTSLCEFIFFVNLLLYSPCVWLFDIWHLFDNLTSFWQLDILISTYKMLPCLLFNLLKALRYSSGNIPKFGIFHTDRLADMVFICKWGRSDITIGNLSHACEGWKCLNRPVWRIWQKFEYFHLNYSALLSDNKQNEVASFSPW